MKLVEAKTPHIAVARRPVETTRAEVSPPEAVRPGILWSVLCDCSSRGVFSASRGRCSTETPCPVS